MSSDKKDKAKHHPLTGPEKVAILMVSLGEERAAQVLKELKPQDVERVVAEIARLGEVTAEKRKTVVKEILAVFDEGRNVSEGGWDYAKGALEKAMGEGRASMIMNQVGRPRREGFSALAAADPDKLVNVLASEHPQTIALILTQIHAEKAAGLLSRLPLKIRPEVTARIAAMDKVPLEVLNELKNVIMNDMGDLLGDSNDRVDSGGGAETTATILNYMDKGIGNEVLDTLSEVDPDLVQEIRNKMFVFEDIRLLDDRSVQQILKQVDSKSLALSLKASSDAIKGLIFKNMSQRAAELMKEEMDLMGPVRLSAVEEAQKSIVAVVRRLEEDGEIVVAGRGGSGKEDALVG